jgi:hypothetical protein
MNNEQEQNVNNNNVGGMDSNTVYDPFDQVLLVKGIDN